MRTKRNRTRALAFAAVAMLAGAASAAGADAPPPRTISVSGQAEVAVAADQAVVALAVETVAARADAAVTDNAERSTRVAAAVKALLGPRDRVETTGYALHPRYEHQEGRQEPRISGYVASNEVRVELHDVETVGKVIDAAIQAGANRVGSLQFTAEDPRAAQAEALELAGKRARAQAEAIARALGVQLGAVQSAASGYTPPPMPKRMEAFAAMARDSMAATPIAPGEVTVSAEVSVVYAIE